MKYNIKINKVELVDEIPNAWSNEDYRQLLDLFGQDPSSISDAELKDYLFMAITENEPEESAVILLNYRLGDSLNEGQIDQISNEMLLDKISEEFADIALHHELYNINQLLRKAYNGKFPNAHACVIDFEMAEKTGKDVEIDEEIILKAFLPTFDGHNVIVRLFDGHLANKVAFPEAEQIIWKMEKKGGNQFQIVTSEYWIGREDILKSEFEGSAEIFAEDEDE